MEPISYPHINAALDRKGIIITTSKSVHVIRATMFLKCEIPLVGDHCSTFCDALASLDSALYEDGQGEAEPLND